MAWQVKVVDGPDRGLETVLSYGDVEMGREPVAAGLVLSCSIASRRHARLAVTHQGKVLIEDLGSSNGTFVNDQLITGPVLLQPGDEFAIGNNRFCLFQVDQSADLVNQGSNSGETVVAKEDTGAASLSFARALVAPFSGRGILKWLIGSVLSIIPLLSFFADGYRYRLFKNGTTGQITLPDWNDWGDLFLKGLLFFAIRVVYLIPVILLTIAVMLAFFFMRLEFNLLTFASVIILVVYAACYFFLPMGLAGYAATGDFKKAFQLRKSVQMVRAIFPRYLLAILIFMALWVLTASLSLIPLVGWVFSILGYFYIYIVTGLLFGEVYRHSLASA